MSYDLRLITPQLTFASQAEEAANFYVSIFEDSEILNTVVRQQDDPGGKQGDILTVTVRLRGYEYLFCNGGPHFHFTDAISLFVRCESQAEIDFYWDKLTAGGGKEGQCGWLTDKFGVSWQIGSARHWDYMKSKDAEAVDRMCQAVFTMTKIDMMALDRAFDGKPAQVPADTHA
ncbi:MAG TPA: VOC family protein [Asticcacaulis sp.]|nr:VOC family protein [Asticcacaulis sp.]